jgi:hypothetical protein
MFLQIVKLCMFLQVINQDSKKHEFETSKDFEETSQKDLREIENIRGFGNL